MKKIFATIMILFMMLSTTVCYGADNLDYVTRALYLYDMGIVTSVGNNPKPGDMSTILPVSRLTTAVVIARVMNATDPNWKKTNEHPYTDVPAWANQYVGEVVSNGIMKGYDTGGYYKFGIYSSIDVKSFTTVLLRALGYGYNDSIQEFTWDDSLNVALEVGLIDDAEYKYFKNKDELYFADMIHLTYNAVKMYNNNPYTDTYLNELIEQNPPSKEIKSLSNSDDPTRAGYLKASFIYYDIYYPDTEEAKACIKLLTPHANKVYAMLQDMYGIQPAFDVYLLPDDQLDTLTQSTAPGQHPIVKNDHMTYVTLNKAQDADGNNLGELIRELNNVFYCNIANLSAKKATYTEDTLPWKVRANMNLIGSLYTKSNYSGKVDQPSMFEIPSMRISLRDADKYGMSLYDKNKLYEFYYYSKLYSLKDPSEFKGCLKNLGAEKTMTLPSMPASMLELDKSFVKPR